MPFAKQYLKRTGTVWVRDFDAGVVGRFARLGLYPGTVFGGNSPAPTKRGKAAKPAPVCEPNSYFVYVPELEAVNVPVFFANPEQSYQQRTLPSVMVRRDSMSQDLARWNSVGHLDYFEGVPGTEIVTSDGVSGFAKVRQKPQAWPFNIFYTISIYARFEHEAQKILKRVLTKFQVQGAVGVVDSLGDVRSYSTYLESDVSDISEIVDVTDRTKGYSFSIRVEGEIDLIDETEVSTVDSIQIKTEIQS